jgi:hypothetical protein
VPCGSCGRLAARAVTSRRRCVGREVQVGSAAKNEFLALRNEANAAAGMPGAHPPAPTAVAAAAPAGFAPAGTLK